ncbi:hypothetical protein L6452_29559 [Arctium lappa]|uniref:Uncharacterized protein n=1 Tax=Arctium lappa TaxID=4217 RepID=A0ACB8ZHX4_ARCLA|nr:hypothetical protein L6452_29559 [Arctium lappa]
MPEARSQIPTVVGSRRSMLAKSFITILFILIIMIGMTILVIWLTIRPKKPFYSVRGGSIHDYSLSKDNLNATYSFFLKSYNPNTRMSIYYGKMEITILFNHETIGSGVIEPWHHPKRNATIFKLDLASRNVKLSETVSRDLKLAKSTNEVVLDMKLKGRVKIKKGVWKSRYFRMQVSCVDVVAKFSNSSKGFQGALCDVDI